MVRWIACLLVVGLAACGGGGEREAEKSVDAGQIGEAVQDAAGEMGAAANQAAEAAMDAAGQVEQEAGEAIEEAEDAAEQAAAGTEP
jgi:hypothetical protein